MKISNIFLYIKYKLKKIRITYRLNYLEGELYNIVSGYTVMSIAEQAELSAEIKELRTKLHVINFTLDSLTQ